MKKGTSHKKSRRVKVRAPKAKTVSSYMCRVLIAGPRHDRQFLHKVQGHSHMKLKKSNNSKKGARGMKEFSKADLYRIKVSLPNWKKNRKVRRYPNYYLDNRQGQ